MTTVPAIRGIIGDKLYKQIEELIKKAGNTTIHHGSTITNNTINLNSYGKEDLSHITDSFKTQLIKGPFKMIPKIIFKKIGSEVFYSFYIGSIRS